MTRKKTIDYHDLVNLNPNVVDQLNFYLMERETRLSHQIIDLLDPTQPEIFVPLLPKGGGKLKLSEAVEGFTKKVRNTSPKVGDGEKVVHTLNQALWDYTEVLEGCATELFLQVEQVNVERWDETLADVVLAIKENLTHTIEDLLWTMKRLETPLREYCQRSGQRIGGWKGWLHLIPRQCIDPHLEINLTQSKKFLEEKYASFFRRYEEYSRLNESVGTDLEKMRSYPALAKLDVPARNHYFGLFKLLKMLELSPAKSKECLIHSLKNYSSIDKIENLFSTYLKVLREAFFKSSLDLKGFEHKSETFQETVARLKARVSVYENELEELMSTIGHYRQFVLKTHPNPYVRSRWGFSEWIVGPEPVYATKLMDQIYSANELLSAYKSFGASLDREKGDQQRREIPAHDEIEKLLHEMGQPLISRSMMRNRAEALLKQIKMCDEISSPHIETVTYVGNVLAKALREDWKYHVLHDFPQFHEIIRFHKGLRGVKDDPVHSFRLERFSHLFHQIEQWIQKGDLAAHLHEFEVDINDMKTYLQDFFATIQRAAKERSVNPFYDEAIEKYRHQLLEYRYLFGQFINTVMRKSPSAQQIRNQFLFFDQYFEAIEALLVDTSL